MEKQHFFIPGFRAPKGLRPDDVAADLEKIGDIYGAITALNVVNYARDPATHLHGAFEWDDSAAAEKFRMHQATTLTRAVLIRIEHIEQPVRMFTLVTNPATERTEYMPTTFVVSRADLLTDGMERLKRELLGALHSVEELSKIAQTEAPQAVKKLAAVGALVQRAAKRL